MSQNFARKYFGESIVPKNITVRSEENTIDIEYNGDHWCYKGGITSLIKNNDKINCRYFDATNMALDYDDGMENFSVPLNKKINTPSALEGEVDTSNKSSIKSFSVSFNEIEKKLKEINHKKKEEEKIIDDHQKIIDDGQKIIKESNTKVNKLNIEITELNEQIDTYYNLLKYESGMPINFSDTIKLLSKELITYEHFVINSTAYDINKITRHEYFNQLKCVDQLKKLIADKKFNINTKNKEGKTLLEITWKEHVKIPMLLLENDIDISSSVKNDIKIHNTDPLNRAYFDNATRNNHLDLLVTHHDDIYDFYLKQLVDEHIKSTKI
jgi:hypothetical protein